MILESGYNINSIKFEHVHVGNGVLHLSQDSSTYIEVVDSKMTVETRVPQGKPPIFSKLTHKFLH